MAAAEREVLVGSKRKANDLEEDKIVVDRPNPSSQRTVTALIYEDDKEHSFEIELNLLVANSQDFKKKLVNCEDEQDIKPLILGNVTVEAFQTFVAWIQADRPATDGIVIEGLAEVSEELKNAYDDEEERKQRYQDEREHRETEREERFWQCMREKREWDYESVPKEEEYIPWNQIPPKLAPEALQGEADDQTTEADMKGDRRDSRFHGADRIFKHLVDLYIFAARYRCSECQRAAMIQLQRCVHTWTTAPSPAVVHFALDNLELHAPLCRYLVLCYGYYGDTETLTKGRLATLPSAFLAETLRIALQRRCRKGLCQHGCHRPCESWCDFHEHSNDDERDECESKRSWDGSKCYSDQDTKPLYPHGYPGRKIRVGVPLQDPIRHME